MSDLLILVAGLLGLMVGISFGLWWRRDVTCPVCGSRMKAAK